MESLVRYLRKTADRKPKRSMLNACVMGMRCGVLSDLAAITVWNTLVRMIEEYTTEIWGTAKMLNAEKIQQTMGRRILGLRENPDNKIARGELGWWKLSTRRDLLRPRF